MNIDDVYRDKLETKREFRYMVMRLVRQLGILIFYASLMFLGFAIVLFLINLPDILEWTFTGGCRWMGGCHMPSEMSETIFAKIPMMQRGLMFGIAIALGCMGISIGWAWQSPYAYKTKMPTTYIRMCHKCGKPLPNKNVVLVCHECGRILPMGPWTFLVRIVNKCVTVTNLVIAVSAAIFCFR